MKPANIEIEVKSRGTGRYASRLLRRTGRVPGVVYGAGIKGNAHFEAEEKLIRKYGSHEFENAIITFKSPDSALNNVKALIKEVFYHPVTRRPIHVDFFALDMTKTVRVPVFKGTRMGGHMGYVS